MEFTKKLNLENIFVFLFLAIFPLGQIVRLGILHPLDIIAGLGAAAAIVKRFPRPRIFKYFENTLLVFLFSWIFGSFLFGNSQIFYGLLYLVRLTGYFYFFLYVWNFAKKRLKNKNLLLDSLLSVSVISAVFGWLQFFMFPDLKPFFTWNWDIHLFRLAGTFLDPTFLSLIIVFGLLLAVNKYTVTRSKFTASIILFLLISLAFTYSRAGYLALFAGLLVIARYKKFMGKAVLSISLFIGFLLLLPTTKNHSIELFRSFSAIARVENYQTTFKIFSRSPVFGIGYDNMCIAYQKYIGPQSFSSHACSGSDSSLLFILTTTGVAGLIVFIYNTILIAGSLKRDSNFIVLNSVFAAVLTHSIFSNSLFYPWIMGWLMVLLATSSLRSEV